MDLISQGSRLGALVFCSFFAENVRGVKLKRQRYGRGWRKERPCAHCFPSEARQPAAAFPSEF